MKVVHCIMLSALSSSCLLGGDNLMNAPSSSHSGAAAHVHIIDPDRLLGTGPLVDLLYCEINKEVLSSLVRRLQDNSVINLYMPAPYMVDDSLQLSSGIGDEGARMLVEGLRGNSSLREINLDYNKIGDELVAAILQSLMGNTNLSEISLKGNEMRPRALQAIEEFKTAHPRTVIITS